jgi:signal transduction histidine kinase
VRVKVTPMQSRIINESQILIFRRIVINSQVYRQGFVIFAKEFLHYVLDTYFSGQPIAEFTQLHLEISDGEEIHYDMQTGSRLKNPVAVFNRIFPRPFSFLQITLMCERLPASNERWILNVMRVLTGVFILVGLVVMYQSARTVMELSERRAQFVSSVTHELKTPLTNIQMYSEMLEQGVALNRDREREYFRIIGTESRRLSRLIDHVLEFSKLSRKQRRFRLQKGCFDDVISDVQEILQEQLQQENFTFLVEKDDNLCFEYDREVMVQILVNVIENSIKFGKTSPTKEIRLSVQWQNTRVYIQVADTGPGIPPADLKHVFDAFYRADNVKDQAVRGTGLGLALVKKYVDALGGTVGAGNNKTSGCTITILLPKNSAQILHAHNR